jgi:hypothetical protein
LLPVTVTTSTAAVPAAGTTHTCCGSASRSTKRGGVADQHPSHGCHLVSVLSRAEAAGAGEAAAASMTQQTHAEMVTTRETRHEIIVLFMIAPNT